ncbi:ribonuclease R [Flavobacteriaceae bacterium]|nr:ribonuclease R [Flavobacteriaceae bacterium]
MPKKSKTKSTAFKKHINRILSILNSSAALNHKQISMKLGINNPIERVEVIECLHYLMISNQIEEKRRGIYTIKTNNKYLTGIFDLTARGSGYIISDDFEEDIYIPSNKTMGALSGDEIEFYILNRKKKGRLEGEVTQILKRSKSEYVGVIQLNKNFAFVVPDDKKMPVDIYVPLKKIKNAKEGQKVLVKIIEWPSKAECPTGKVVEVLGDAGDHQTEIHAILAAYGLPYKFDKKVEDFANNLDTSITEEEIKKRRDMRQILTFTIDPKDAKDFDDALSFQILKNGNYEIGIHIADVSHYLQEGTILDDEAYERATSVYLVDRVVPMLPEVLSNNACSLRPNEEKYTFSAVFELNNNADLINKWFGRTVTYSDARFSYEEAQHIIEAKDLLIPKEIALTKKQYKTTNSIKEAILKLDDLAKILRAKRMSDGAISFDKKEVKFTLSINKEPEGVYFKTSKDANKLIEEFMLLANKKVAEFIGKQTPKKTFIYRVHDVPDQQKLESLQRVVSQFGHQINIKDQNQISSSLNKLLINVVGKKEQNLVDTLAIRCMSKAEYSTQNIGHYGLSFDYYSHFTSPIRRYPDVMAHRLLQHYLDGNKKVNATEFEEKCKHSSSMENLATKAERDSIKYMQIKYMMNKKNTPFLGIISGVTEWGMYVEIIENKCEGMVRVKDISGDYYSFDQDNYALIGERTKNKYQLGDQVEVQVKKADLLKRHLDFKLT